MKIRFQVNKFVLILGVLVSVFGLAENVMAASTFPEIMIGNTTVTANGQKVYGGLGGNYSILNTDQSGTLGFDKTAGLSYVGCLNQAFGLLAPTQCFTLGTGIDGSTHTGITYRDMLMISRTYIDGSTVPSYELPALIFNGLNVNGDVFSGSPTGLSYLAKFWNPANLFQGLGTQEGAGWNPGTGYVFNPAAQVKLDSANGKDYSAKLATLATNGTPLTSASIFATGGPLYLQGSTFADNSNSDSTKYPDGKIWTFNTSQTVLLGQKITFSGVGTIIITGNLNVLAGASFVPADTNSRLGIIVLKNAAGSYGDCAFRGNNKIQAMVFCANTFTASANGEFTGSFVASNFSISTASSVLFSYDPAFDNGQPPGFRNLAMPGTKEVGNR